MWSCDDAPSTRETDSEEEDGRHEQIRIPRNENAEEGAVHQDLGLNRLRPVHHFNTFG